LETFATALQHIARSPLIGVGLDDESSQVTIRNTLKFKVHNSILLLWFSSGILGFLGIILIYWKSFGLAVCQIRASALHPQATDHLGLAAATIGFILVDMTQPGVYQRQKWLVFALLYSGVYMTRKLKQGTSNA